MNLTRRETLTLAAAATAAGIAGWPAFALAKEGDVIDQLKLMAPNGIPDKVAGSPDAKVIFIEYASPTCPHCALFSNTVLEPFRAKYVTTGKVKFILRPFARNTLDAAIFMLAEAAAKSVDAANAPPAASSEPSAPSSEASASSSEPAAPAVDPNNPSGYSQAAIAAYENVISTYFRTQQTWGVSDKPLDAVKAVAIQLGFSEGAFNTALTNQELFTAIETMRDQAMKDFGLEGTPTFYLNGKQMVGEKTLEQLSAEIDPLL
ncbi:MAG: thioredoxin domain-containing protein [Devosia nanyangense]|uniref:Thioredoxin domain-containing protein n=1 Tax=Devosia nanyangense TaxID=1228055 RepID=A0A933L4F4_9HYPH|nr:thioredoxin domain-containing protein [Devosia nanyangense]